MKLSRADPTSVPAAGPDAYISVLLVLDTPCEEQGCPRRRLPSRPVSARHSWATAAAVLATGSWESLLPPPQTQRTSETPRMGSGQGVGSGSPVRKGPWEFAF